MNAQIDVLSDADAEVPKLRCLWISREIPFPQDAGDRIYSANLSRALTRANAYVRYLGYPPAQMQTPTNWVSDCIAVKGRKRAASIALLSHHPHIAALHASSEFKKLLRNQLDQSWDAIILDGYASGWALSLCLKARLRNSSRPQIVYLSHNHEESLWRTMAQSAPLLTFKRLGLWQNYLKARHLERKLVANVDLVCAITAEDALAYTKQPGLEHQLNTLVLTPGYAGTRISKRQITDTTPRRVLVMGSFRWIIKQQNLRKLIELADAEFAKHNIQLDIIGDVPAELLAEFSGKVTATHFHGFVGDVSAYFSQARIALVPEVVGGGFKLKFLDYVFGRVPVISIATATAGVPKALSEHITRCADLSSLIQAVVGDIDNIEKLDRMQEQAYTQADSLFDWQQRGHALVNAIQSLRLCS